jgi:S-disulfanyl-L-cysteine oxidoreductase SoxD
MQLPECVRIRNIALALVVAVSGGAVGLQSAAADTRLGFGEPVSETELSNWNLTIHTPSGAGLPPGEGTVAAGKAVYEGQCASCHGVEARGGEGMLFGSMVGGIGSMKNSPRVLTPASMYPYAPILFDYVRRSMPMTNPQSLSADEVYAVSAYLYHLNGLIGEDFVMNAETMPQIMMPNRDAFIPAGGPWIESGPRYPRPDVASERCMADCRPIGSLHSEG